jgi:hypothetical protein
MLRDLHNNITVSNALDTQVISTNTTTVGDIIDTKGNSAVEFVIQSGTLTNGAFAVLIEEGDAANLSDAAAVADADLLGTESDAGFAATDDNTVTKIGYIGDQRYVRLSIVSTSVTSGGTLGAVAVLKPLMRGTTG